MKSSPVIVYKDIPHIEDEGKSIKNKSYLYFKVSDEQGNSLTSVASKLIADSTSCYITYSDFDGLAQLSFDQSKITSTSYLEIVFKGFSKKRIPVASLKKEQLQFIQLKKGDSIVSEEAYKMYYFQIRSCWNW
ncbi:hypothetical protein [uncultured Kordia sp.]|uniref:hypothetical protein n=1 Tax=uncultured Kordia sp. TaxID=507699 RepID=UPI00260CF7DE|nr:hypothetical protein [uncultured Kordia sp.]